MLQGWKNMHPEQHYIKEHVDLYEHIDDPAYIEKEETFKSWDENPIDLPGRWYLQVITQLFKENRLAKGTFMGLGRLRALASLHSSMATAGRPRRIAFSPRRRSARSRIDEWWWVSTRPIISNNRDRLKGTLL
jgi:hypothetical protein